MPKRNFKATDGLLNDTMRKQSGVLEKALLEAVMNATDANASHVDIAVEKNRVVIEDDGDGITEERVEQYFEKFGNMKDSVEGKEFGKFQMGRGQIFNFGVNVWRSKDNIMVVSLDDKEVVVNLESTTTADDDSVLDVSGHEYTLDTEGLSYAWLKSDQEVDGTRIEILLYNTIDNVASTVAEFKDLARYIPWMHDVDVSINGDDIDDEPEVINETDLAYYVSYNKGIGSRSAVYNQGALVDTFSLGQVQLGIISKVDLDVTLDRTDILDTDDNWQAIKDEYQRLALDIIKKQDDVSKREQKWLLGRMTEDVKLVKELSDVPIATDINGDQWTIEALSDQTISFAQAGDKVAEEAMQRSDTVMINEQYQTEMTEFIQSAKEALNGAQAKDYSNVVDEDMKYEMDEVSDDKLSKKRNQNLQQLRGFLKDLGFSDEVKAGHSKHHDVWKDDNGVLFIDKDFLNAKKSVFKTQVTFQAVRIASHSGDTRGGVEDDISWRRQFKKMMEGEVFGAKCSYPEAQIRLEGGHYN